jgi:hypothetical protein
MLFEELYGKINSKTKEAAFQNFKVKLNPSLLNRAFPKFEQIKVLERSYIRMMENKFGMRIMFRPTSTAEYDKLRGAKVVPFSKKCTYVGIGVNNGITGHHGHQLKEGKVTFTPDKRSGVAPFRVALKELKYKAV